MTEAATVTLDVYLVLARKDAMLVALPDGGNLAEKWLPRSLVEVLPGGAGKRLRIRLPRWKALEAGLIAEAGDGQGRLL